MRASGLPLHVHTMYMMKLKLSDYSANNLSSSSLIHFVCIVVASLGVGQLQRRQVFYEIIGPPRYPFWTNSSWVAPLNTWYFPQHTLFKIDKQSFEEGSLDYNLQVLKLQWVIYNTAWEVGSSEWSYWSVLISDVFHNYLHFFYNREISSYFTCSCFLMEQLINLTGLIDMGLSSELNCCKSLKGHILYIHLWAI